MFCKASPIASHVLSLPLALVGVLTVLSQPQIAIGQTLATKGDPAVQFYRIDAGPLAQSLDDIAAVSGRRIAYDKEGLKGATAHEVKGNFSAGAAVSLALSGGGFSMNEDDSGLIAVTPTTTVQITATRDEAETSFKATRSDTATRSGTDLHDVPGSITLITSKILETQQATDLQAALRNVSGLSFRQSPQGLPTFSIRGFSSMAASNGVADSHAASTNIFGVERVEVLKGPQAILAGGNALGGAVNVVLKKPQADVIRDLTVQYGSMQDRTAVVDLSGPLTSDRRLTYRMIGAASKAGRSDANYRGRGNDSFTPSIRWKDDATDFIVWASYTDQHAPLTRYTFARRDGVILPAPDMRLANPDDGIKVTDKRVSYQLDRKLTASLTLISRMQYTENDLDLASRSPSSLAYAPGAPPNAPSGVINFYSTRTFTDDRTLSGDHYLRYVFRNAGILHKLSVGVNHTEFKFHQRDYEGPTLTAQIYPASNFAFPAIRDAEQKFSSESESGQRQKAVYAQDTVTLGDWTAMINLRRNVYTNAAGYLRRRTVIPSVERRTLSTTPGAGLVYRVSDVTSLYGSYAEGFLPQTTLTCSGIIAAPIETRNREVGAKFDLMDGKVALTTSAFSLQQSNRLIYNAANSCYNLRDAQNTKGFEVDVQGQVARGLDVVMNYTYNQMKDVQLPTELFPGYAKHKYSAWAVYRLRQAALKGFGVGLGINGNSALLGTSNRAYPFTIPGQAQVDASLTYQQGPWNVIFGVKNLRDKLLFDAATDSSFIPILQGRRYMLTVKRSFN